MIASDLDALIKASYMLDNNLLSLLQPLQQSTVIIDYNVVDGLIRRKGKIIVGPDTNLRNKIIN